MAHRRRNRKIYYYVLESRRYLFADERDKRKLLDILSDVGQEEEWLVYAFCLMDNAAYFVIEASGAASVRRGIQRAAGRFLGECGANQAYAPRREAALAGSEPRELESLKEIADCCRQIHRIPLEEGYVGRLADYWWSSYITYAGGYEWELVDCRVFSLCFSADPEVARRRLLRFHQ